MWDFSCPDWEDRLRNGRSLVPELPLYREEAAMSVEFYNQLRLPDVPGTPLLRDAGGDWFRDIVAALFGSRDPETNVRHVHEILTLVGKGNSKTTNGAALMIVALLMNVRPRAEFLLVGPTQAISELAFSQAAGMIELDRELKKRFKPREHLKQIDDLQFRAKLKVKTFDLDILTGPRPIGVLVDEVHLLGKRADTPKVLRQIRGGLEKSTEGFLLMITTQSDEQPAGAFRDELNVARAIRDGRHRGRMLPVLYEYPEEIARDPVQWQDPRNWPMVMPNLGRSLQLDSLIEDWNAERIKGEAAIRVWASQHLNIEIGIGIKTDRWRGADHWPAAKEPGLTRETLLQRSEVVDAGIDGGGLDDLFALVLLGREAGTRRWLQWARAWMHRSVLELRKSEASRLLDLVEAGDLVIVDDMQTAIDEAADIVAEVDAMGLLDKVGLDPMGIGAVVDALAERDIGGDSVVGISQGWKLNGAIKTAEVKLANGTMVHCGQELMSYAVGNAKVEPKGNAITITKQMSGTAKIDPLMATFNGVALMSLNPAAEDQFPADYELPVLA